jgi:hypothetical protein
MDEEPGGARQRIADLVQRGPQVLGIHRGRRVEHHHDRDPVLRHTPHEAPELPDPEVPEVELDDDDVRAALQDLALQLREVRTGEVVPASSDPDSVQARSCPGAARVDGDVTTELAPGLEETARIGGQATARIPGRNPGRSR